LMRMRTSFTTENFWKLLQDSYQSFSRKWDELKDEDVHFIEQRLQWKIYTFDEMEEDLVPLSHTNYPDLRCSIGHEQTTVDETDFLLH
jgi:hypothetical protein